LSVVFDSDDSQGKNNNIASCFKCTENDLQINIDKIKKVETSNQNLYVFEKDFETALKKDFNDDAKWIEYENEAKEIIKPRPNTQKGQIARFICKKILEDQNYKPLFLQELVKEIQNLNETENTQSITDDDLPF